jgi:hypothetical protein
MEILGTDQTYQNANEIKKLLRVYIASRKLEVIFGIIFSIKKNIGYVLQKIPDLHSCNVSSNLSFKFVCFYRSSMGSSTLIVSWLW